MNVTNVDGFPDALRSLEPLCAPWLRRELLVGTANRWCAYFNSAINGTDAAGAMCMLAELAQCRTFQVTAMPHHPLRGRYGCVRLVVFDREANHPLRIRRAITVMADVGGRWIFELVGEAFEFEDVSRYSAKRKRDRFTLEMLEAYCRSLGFAVFDTDYYNGPAILLENQFPHVEGATAGRDASQDLVRRSLAEAQRYLGISPG